MTTGDDSEPYHFDAVKSIAIVGAGSCGIVLAKAALCEGFKSIRIFEERPDLGGAWLYTPETSKPQCVPSDDAFVFDPPLPGSPPTFISPMYTNLWANTPRDIMTFAEKDFPKGTPVFPFRTQILQYLKEYGESVRHMIDFNTEVVKVEKRPKWSVTVRDTRDHSKISTQQFDAVAIASGHYETIFIPPVPGIECFPKEKISHAKYFRHARTYKDKNILLVGNGPSGADLANQLLHYANSVHRSVRSEPNSLAVTNPKVKDVGPLKRFTNDSIELVDGTVFTDIDMVIFCTGYLYSLPMFPKETGFITGDGSYVHQLYDQTFYVEDPRLVFMGLPKKVIPFPTFQNQAIVVAKVWAEKLSLPSRTVMRKDEFDRLEKKGFDGMKYHSFDFSEDIELAEHWRKWAEEDKSDGWEKSMKPWHWTDERVEYRKRTPDIKGAFCKEIENGRWDLFELDRP